MYEALFGYHVFGLGFVTSMAFIIGTGPPLSMPVLSMLCLVSCLQPSQSSKEGRSVRALWEALRAVLKYHVIVYGRTALDDTEHMRCGVLQALSRPSILGRHGSALHACRQASQLWRRAGVLMSSWLGGLLLQVGEWIIRKLPLVKHIYSAAKQARAPPVPPPHPPFSSLPYIFIAKTAAWQGRPFLRCMSPLPPSNIKCALVPAHGRRRGCTAPSSSADAGFAEQVSAAVNPANEGSQSFQECVLIRHPRHGEFAFGFITGSTSLQVRAHPALLLWVEWSGHSPV